jgi:hypothetical protein
MGLPPDFWQAVEDESLDNDAVTPLRLRAVRCSRFESSRHRTLRALAVLCASLATTVPPSVASHTRCAMEMMIVASVPAVLSAIIARAFNLQGPVAAWPLSVVLPFDAPVSAHEHAINVTAIMAAIVAATMLFALLYRWQLKWVLSLLVLVVCGLVLGALVAVIVSCVEVVDVVTVVIVSVNVGVGVPLAVCLPSSWARWQLSTTCRLCVLVCCVGLAWPFLCLPEGTLWATIASLVMWDIVAVLCPHGPLIFIVRSERKRRRLGLPSLLPPGLVYQGATFDLGTGDLVLFAVLVARGATLDIVVAAGTAVAVLAGIAGTVFMVLIASRTASEPEAEAVTLPALPLSLVAGTACYFGCQYFVRDYVFDLAHAGVFV